MSAKHDLTKADTMEVALAYSIIPAVNDAALQDTLKQVAAVYIAASTWLMSNLIKGRGRSLALTHLEESFGWAVKALQIEDITTEELKERLEDLAGISVNIDVQVEAKDPSNDPSTS